METPATENPQDSIIDLSNPDETIETRDDKKIVEKAGEAADEPAHEEHADEERVEERAEDIEREDAEVREGVRHRGESSEEYGRRVRARINRERALRMRTERKLDESNADNQELRERVARLERRQTVSEVSTEAKQKIKDIDAKITTATAALTAAAEAGDTAKQMNLNIEISGLIADKKLLEQRAEDQRVAAERAANERGTEERAGEREDPRIARMTARWQTANRKWWNLNRFSGVKKDAVELDIELRSEVGNGAVDMEEYSDEYFAELSSRLKGLYPDLDVRGLDGEAIELEADDVDRTNSRERDRDRDSDRGQRSSSRRPAAGSMGTHDRRRGGGDAAAMASQGRVRLSAPDYAQMRTYGLDPNNEAHKKRFAKERMRTILSGDGESSRRGGGR